MKKILPIALILCLVGLLVWGCGSGGGTSSTTTGGTTPTPTPTPTTDTVNVAANASNPTGFAFAGPTTVKSGTSVTWVNTTSAPHSIVWDSHTPSTSPAPGADIGTFTGGSTSAPWIAPTVTVSTTYAYHCGIHGPQMAGQIIVTP
jgi:plastocyanin